MEEDIKKDSGLESLDAFSSSFCPVCSIEIDLKDFDDMQSVKEFRISGLCQVCQDKIFSK